MREVRFNRKHGNVFFLCTSGRLSALLLYLRSPLRSPVDHGLCLRCQTDPTLNCKFITQEQPLHNMWVRTISEDEWNRGDMTWQSLVTTCPSCLIFPPCDFIFFPKCHANWQVAPFRQKHMYNKYMWSEWDLWGVIGTEISPEVQINTKMKEVALKLLYLARFILLSHFYCPSAWLNRSSLTQEVTELWVQCLQQDTELKKLLLHGLLRLFKVLVLQKRKTKTCSSAGVYGFLQIHQSFGCFCFDH